MHTRVCSSISVVVGGGGNLTLIISRFSLHLSILLMGVVAGSCVVDTTAGVVVVAVGAVTCTAGIWWVGEERLKAGLMGEMGEGRTRGEFTHWDLHGGRRLVRDDLVVSKGGESPATLASSSSTSSVTVVAAIAATPPVTLLTVASTVAIGTVAVVVVRISTTTASTTTTTSSSTLGRTSSTMHLLLHGLCIFQLLDGVLT